MLGLPNDWFGEITDTASASTLYALAAAREAAGLDIREHGMAGWADLPPLAIYTSTQAHSSVDKAAIALGISGRLLWSKTNCGEIPHCRINRTVVYPIHLLKEYLTDNSR